MKLTILSIVAVVACFGQGQMNVVKTGAEDASALKWIPPTATFASPPSSPLTGSVYFFTDATALGTCSGGGSALATCRWSGSAWAATSGGSGGSGTVTASGSPLIHQLPVWTTGTDIKGIAVGATDKAFVGGGSSADPLFSKLTLTNPATSATLTVADGASLITVGANSLTLTSTGTTNATLPVGTKTLVATDGNVATATALAANGTNCSAGQYPLGVDASGNSESCTALPTTISGTANQITASASTGAITLSIPTNPTLPGTTTGTFSGNLTGNASGTAATITGAITQANTVLTTKGDLIGTNGTTLARLGVGSDGQVFTADAASTNGFKWAAASGGATALKRTLLGGLTANCNAGVVSGSGWSMGATGYPSALCEADGFSGYLQFTAGTSQAIYSRFELPSDLAGTMYLTTTAWSTGTSTPTTFTATHYCVSTGATSGGSYANSQAISITMAGSSGRSTSTPLALDTTGCSAGNEYYLKLTIQANTTALNLIRASVLESTPGTKRIFSNGLASVCQSGTVAGSGWSTGATAAPTSVCEADGFSAYLAFTAGSAQNIYNRIELPSDWGSTLKLIATAWSTGTSTPTTFTATHYCVGTGATSGGSYANSQNITITIGGSSGRSVSSTATLDTTGCAAGNEYYLKLTVNANTTNLNLLRASITE